MNTATINPNHFAEHAHILCRAIIADSTEPAAYFAGNDTEEFAPVSHWEYLELTAKLRTAARKGEVYAKQNGRGDVLACYQVDDKTFRIRLNAAHTVQLCAVDYSAHSAEDVRAFWAAIARGDIENVPVARCSSWAQIWKAGSL